MLLRQFNDLSIRYCIALIFFCAYIDDLLTASNSLEKHYQHVQMVFRHLDEYVVVINPSKCRLSQAEIKFLGHLIRKEGIRPLSSNIDVINGFHTPTSRRKLNQILTMLHSYSHFFPLCVTVAFSLTNFSSSDINKIELTTGLNEESVQPRRYRPGVEIHLRVNDFKICIGWCFTISS